MNGTFSSRIKELRTSLKMTQSDFASSIGSSQNALSAYENGDRSPSCEILISIAKEYNISIDWLCGLSSTKQLDSTYRTYADVLKVFVKLCSTKYDNDVKNLVTASIVNSSDNIHFIVRNDDVFNSFFKNWQKMYNLLQENVINSDIYNQWLEGQLSEYDNHPINGIPFW